MGENREKISKAVGTSKGSDVAKKGGEMWKAMTDAARAPYEKRSKEAKDAYEKYIATDAGRKALEEKKAGKAEEKAEKAQKAEALAERKSAKEEKRNERACKAAVKAVEKDDKLKKPVSSYWLWLADNREKITAMVGTNVSAVGKKGGEMWNGLSAAAKAPYEKKAKEAKDAYDKYIASPEGAAALKAFNDAKQAAKAEFAPKVAAETTEETVGKKRKAAVLGA